MSSPLTTAAGATDDEVHFTSPRRLSTDAAAATTTTTTTHHSSPSVATPSPPNPIIHVPVAAPPSPGSPWSLSPLRTSPSPSLLHHCIASLHRHEGNIYSIAVAKGVVFTGSESSRIRAWRHPDCTERGYVKSSCGHVRAVLAYGNALFSAHKDHKIRIWNFTLSSDGFKIKKVATLPRTNSSPIMFPFRRFTIYNSSTKYNSNVAPRHQQHRDNVSCMAYYHAEGLLYTGSHDRTVKVWRVHDRMCVDSFQAHDEGVTSVLVNQDDGCVFSSSSDGSVKVWRRVYLQDSHTLTMTLRFQHSPVNALALTSSVSGCFLYSGSSDGTINFWEKERFSGRFNHSGFLQGHRFAVLCLASVSERLVFSGSEDTSIRVWRREGGGSGFHECLAVLDGHRGPVRCLAVCLENERVGNGFLVYSAGLDQSFKVWRVKVLMEEDDHHRTNNHSGEKLGMGLTEYCHISGEGLMKRRNSNVESISCSSSTTTTVGDLVLSHSNSSKVMEYEISPVLSPSWVEKKLRKDNFL
ncbi:unnamed protein product [Linum tenue]|uniref:Uncharacterized protein n=1 Tax=Linum tenue TaxID=586396 RepID=A0AAV0JEY2_9ROSI|nr:unnamed protein product [Linum tenue]